MVVEKTILQSAAHRLLHKGFTEWLQLLGYSPLSIPGLTGNLKDFLLYQEQNNKTSLQELVATDANNFTAWLQTQTGGRTKKAFSNGHVNKYIQSLKLFSRYIRETKQSTVAFNLQRLEAVKAKPVWLTQIEVQSLYDAIPETGLGIRDRAMLAVYYGCGLRLNEGANLETKDIDRTAGVLHVRKGKGNNERFVPMAQKNLGEVTEYLHYARPQLLRDSQHDCFFVDANRGLPLGRQALYLRIRQLARRAELRKKVGMHTLRHSIATHLLQNGMALEMIQRFLGHADLDSTQIYTHLANE